MKKIYIALTIISLAFAYANQNITNNTTNNTNTKKEKTKKPKECQTKKYCKEMISCEEAKFYFEVCGHNLDKDKDGIPCENVCK